MNMMRWGLLATVFFVTILFMSSQTAYGDPGKVDPIGNRYIVVYKSNATGPTVTANASQNLPIRAVYNSAFHGFAADLDRSQVAALLSDPNVAIVEADRVVSITEQIVPTGIDRIQAELDPTAAIDGIDTRVDVDIAFIDTGVKSNHPDLNLFVAANCIGVSPCVTNAGYDDHGHGTHTAGTAGALDNNIGVVGVAPGARIWSAKAMNSNGNGSLVDVITAIDWITANSSQIDIANLSIGWLGNSAAARIAVQNSVAKGVTYFVSAGNSRLEIYGSDGVLGTGDDVEPATYLEVATVTALSDTDGIPFGLGPLSSYGASDLNGDGIADGTDDAFASFSNYSNQVDPLNPVTSPGNAIDLMMPGVDILSTSISGNYTKKSGTSMSSPHAAGLAALVVAANGRDINSDGLINQFDTYALRQQLIDAAIDQTALGGMSFQNDPDSAKERIGVAGTSIGSVPIAAPGGPYSGTEGSSVTLNGSLSSDSDGSIHAHQWDFDYDGSNFDVDAEGSSVANNFQSGQVTVALRVADDDGLIGLSTANVTVSNVAPTADAGGPYSGGVGTNISVDGSASSDPGNDITSFMWDFDGDGLYDDAVGSSATFVAPSEGTFPIALMVTDDDGASSTDSTTVTASVAVVPSSVPTQDYLRFDGSDDRVDIADSADLDLTGGSFTISAYIRPTSWGQNLQGRIVDHGGGSSGNTGWVLGLENKQSKGSPHSLRLQINNSKSFNTIASPGAITLNEWQHVAATLDAGTLTFYVDGQIVGTSTGVPTPAARNTDVRIGLRSTDTKRAFEGDIDDVQIWDRALSQIEIQQMMGSELLGTEPGLLAYYDMNEGMGQAAADGTANGHNGTLGSTGSADSADPLWIAFAPPANTAPVVNAGVDQVIVMPTNSVTLSGTATDDGLPAGTLINTWSDLNSTGNVNFGEASLLNTTATFAAPGTYELVLTSDDSALSSTDSLIVVVEAAPVLTSMVVSPDPVTLSLGEVQNLTAQGFDQSGNPFAINALWTATGGSIVQTGLDSATYTAGQTDDLFDVTASDGSISDSVPVTIVDPNTGIWPTDGWTPSTPAEQNMNLLLLEQARDYALTGGGSGIITRGGKVVMTWGDQDSLYSVRSTSKSVSSIALGLAISDGLVTLDDLAQTHLPEVGTPPTSNTDSGWLPGLTIKQLATQTGGFDKPGGFGDLLFQPGTAWAYSDGGPNWLADLLTVVFAQDMYFLMFERAFDHLGITISDFDWRSHGFRPDTINGIKRREFASGMSIDVDAMAKIGYLFLRNGQWDTQQIIPSSFVDAASSTVPEVVGLPVQNDIDSKFENASNHYGMLWWNNADGSMPNVPTDAFWSWGFDNSHIIVIPSLDIVAARAGTGWSGSEVPSFYRPIEPFISRIASSVTNSSVPVAHIGGPYNGDEGSTFVLNGTASFSPGFDIVSYEWDLDNDGVFNDATAAVTTFNPTESGLIPIALRVTDTNGATDIDATTMTVNNIGPTADSGGPYTGVEGVALSLDGSASSAPGNDIILYEWDLDNDSLFDDATGVTTVFSSTDSGLFTISLRVTDADGATSVDSTTVDVSNVAPTANAGGTYSGLPNVNVPLDGSASFDPGLDIVSYEWDLDNDSFFDDAVGATTTFLSANSGVFTISLRVTDENGASGVDSTTVTISGSPPTANVGGPYFGNEGASIALNGSASSDPNNDIVLYEWDLDNDTFFDDAVGVATSFTSTDSGLFTVSLKVTDVDGASSVGSTTVDVANVDPTADAGGPYLGSEGDSIALDGSASFDPGIDIVLHEWDLDNDLLFDDATGATTSFSSTDSGIHTVGLRVTDADGASNSTTTTVTVDNVAPTANADGPYVGTVGTSIDLDGSASFDPGLDIVSYEWDLDNDSLFDDAIGVTASFTSAVTGPFLISLRVTDDDGASDVNSTTVTVNEVSSSVPTETYLLFDGSNDRVDIADSDALDLTGGSFTISAYINASGWGQNDQGRIVDHGGGSSGSSGWVLGLENKQSRGREQTLRFQINNSSVYDSRADDDAIFLDEWQHVAVTLNAGTLTFYVDGAVVGTRTGVPTPVARAAPVRIGLRATDTNRAFDGAIDDVQIWDRALSQTEIQLMIGTELTGSETGLVAYYNLNEGSGQDASDGSGNGHDGTLGSSASADAADPGWVP